VTETGAVIDVAGLEGTAGELHEGIVVLADRPYVVDVNPRPTTSMVGIAACMEEEIARVLVDASYGKAPASVHLSGRVRFDKDGRLERL